MFDDECMHSVIYLYLLIGLYTFKQHRLKMSRHHEHIMRIHKFRNHIHNNN